MGLQRQLEQVFGSQGMSPSDAAALDGAALTPAAPSRSRLCRSRRLELTPAEKSPVFLLPEAAPRSFCTGHTAPAALRDGRASALPSLTEHPGRGGVAGPAAELGGAGGGDGAVPATRTTRGFGTDGRGLGGEEDTAYEDGDGDAAVQSTSARLARDALGPRSCCWGQTRDSCQTTRTGRGLDSPQGWVAGSGLTLGHVHLDAGRSDGGGRVEPRGGRSRWPGPVGRSAGGPSQGGPADLTAARVVCAHGVRARGRAEPARERPPGAAHKADWSRGSPGRESVACPAAGAEGRTRLTGAFGHPDGLPPAGLPRRCCSRLDKGLTLSPQS